MDDHKTPSTGMGPEEEERLVETGFWDKVRQTLGKVPFTEQAVAAWYCAMDGSTPARVRVTLIGALAYFVLPVDAIPDFILGLGFTDDAAVLAAAMRMLSGHVKDEHRQQARLFLEKEGDED